MLNFFIQSYFSEKAVSLSTKEISTLLTKGDYNEVTKLNETSLTDAEDAFYRNPLHHAVHNKDEKVLQYLLELNKELVETWLDKPYGGVTPLHEAAYEGNINAIRCLLKHGANFNQKDVTHRDIVSILQMGRHCNLTNEVKNIIENIDLIKNEVRTPIPSKRFFWHFFSETNNSKEKAMNSLEVIQSKKTQ